MGRFSTAVWRLPLSVRDWAAEHPLNEERPKERPSVSIPQFARALETNPESQPVKRTRRVAALPALHAVLPAPLAIALISELQRVAGSGR